ncbi:uncharacterized protein LOC111087875 [Limulus polyphemus]|uniref:Uncharacterized protein LOC111087875 n=1 Tax=Limulus polyphemus TaxID=6850 RepID=A0ABM1T7I1_LIMPO|nr:uncharacterized protein LOC111087875 [Limulus polyphemus]
MYEAVSSNNKHIGLTQSVCKNGTANLPQRSISSCTTNLAFSRTGSIVKEASTSEHWIAVKGLHIYKREELERLSKEELKLVVTNLSAMIEAKSEELVPLLQERDAMLDEIEARNVSIEQLLKLTGTSKI